MAVGWIKLHRKILDSKIWNTKEPFDKRSAWVDLLLIANHDDKQILFNDEVITVKRGQIITSLYKLAERWRWSRDKVRRYLETLTSLGMCTRESDNNKTTITIENYGLYQDYRTTDNTTNNTTGNTTDNTQTRIYKNIKKERKEPLNDSDYDESFELLIKGIGGNTE